MTAYSLDASALVKRYADEAGSDWIRQITDSEAGHTIIDANRADGSIVSFRSHDNL